MGKNIEDLIWKIVQTKLDNNPEYQKLKELRYGKFNDLYEDAYYDWSEDDGYSRVHDYKFKEFQETIDTYEQRWEALDKESKKLVNALFHKKEYNARKYWLNVEYSEAQAHLQAKEKYDAMVEELGGKTIEDVKKEIDEIQIQMIKEAIAENRNAPEVVGFITKALLDNGDLPEDIDKYNLTKKTIYETIYSEARAVIQEQKASEIEKIQANISETNTENVQEDEANID